MDWAELSALYYELGICVIPVSGKVPLVQNWSVYCHELPEEPVLTYGRNQTGIGVCLGKSGNLIALDIDTEDELILSKCPMSPIRRRGKKGEVRFFQYTENIQTSHFPSLKIDILSTGSQVVLPPSIHPDTKSPYEWMNENTLLNFNLEYLPVLDLSFLSELQELNVGSSTLNVGRQAKLKSIAVAALVRGEEYSYVANEVYEYDLKNHVPRWFTDENDQYKAKSEDEAYSYAMLFVINIARTLITAKQLKPRRVDLLNNFTIEPAAVNKFELKSYPDPVGYLKDFSELIVESSYTIVPNMALGSAISIFSILCGNSYAFEDVKANVFCLLLADSGTGKKFGINVARSLLSQHGLVGSADYLSSSAISSSLSDFCIRLDVSDEFSKTLKLSVDGNAFQAAMLQDLCRLWSASVDGFDLPVLRKQSQDEVFPTRVDSPFISILTATTLYEFKDSTKRNAFTSGFIPRFLIFMDKPSKTIKTRLNYELLNEKKEKCEKIVKRFLAIKGTLGVLRTPIVNNCPLSHDSYDYFNSKMTSYYESSMNEENESMKAMKNRSREYLKKLALLHAISRVGLKIEMEDLEWASQVVDISLYNMGQFVAEASAENKQQAEKERVLGIIRENPGIALNKLTDKTRFLNSMSRKAIIEDLIHEERIMYREVKCDKNGKNVKCFYPLMAR